MKVKPNQPLGTKVKGPKKLKPKTKIQKIDKLIKLCKFKVN
jgi:hypothetical protein